MGNSMMSLVNLGGSVVVGGVVGSLFACSFLGVVPVELLYALSDLIT